MEFKLCVSDQKTGKTFQKVVKDADAKSFMGMNIGDAVKGEVIGATGFEFKITGGSDFCGFPMRRGILGVRKKITVLGGVGFRGKGRRNIRRKGMQKRKTVCGHKISDSISQINLVVTKAGAKKLNEALGVEEKKKEGKEESKEKPAAKEAKKPEAKEAPKAEEKPKEEAKPAEKEEPKADAKPEEKK